MDWQPTAEEGELAHGARVVAAPTDSDSQQRVRWRGRVEENAGWVDTRIEAVGRWETHQGLASTTARSGRSKLAVLGGASRRGAWLAGRRAAQPQCPARGGGGRPAQNRRHAVHSEAPQTWMVDGLGLLRAALHDGQRFWEGSCSVAPVDGGLTAAASRSGAEAERQQRSRGG
jgi:hypothetical protein